VHFVHFGFGGLVAEVWFKSEHEHKFHFLFHLFFVFVNDGTKVEGRYPGILAIGQEVKLDGKILQFFKNGPMQKQNGGWSTGRNDAKWKLR
jgi:hypothetical protein